MVRNPPAGSVLTTSTKAVGVANDLGDHRMRPSLHLPERPIDRDVVPRSTPPEAQDQLALDAETLQVSQEAAAARSIRLGNG